MNDDQRIKVSSQIKGSSISGNVRKSSLIQIQSLILRIPKDSVNIGLEPRLLENVDNVRKLMNIKVGGSKFLIRL